MDSLRLKKNVDNQSKPELCSQCPGCGIVEKSAADVKLNSGWIACYKCKTWFHEVCAEAQGVFDDDFFLCGDCVE